MLVRVETLSHSTNARHSLSMMTRTTKIPQSMYAQCCCTGFLWDIGHTGLEISPRQESPRGRRCSSRCWSRACPRDSWWHWHSQFWRSSGVSPRISRGCRRSIAQSSDLSGWCGRIYQRIQRGFESQQLSHLLFFPPFWQLCSSWSWERTALSRGSWAVSPAPIWWRPF